MLTARVMAVLTLGVAPFVLFDVMTREYAGALLVVEPSCRVNALNKLTPLDVVINSCVDTVSYTHLTLPTNREV